jgi:poly(hydroxyalkanoate) depolymerase family esterase
MTKSLTKKWLGGMKTLWQPSVQSLSRELAAASAPLAELFEPVAETATVPALRPLSRVRPREADWAAGAWTRDEFPLPMVPGRRATQLAYGLYIPPTHSARGLPLVVMLHGCGQNIDQFSLGTRMNLLADQHGFAVLYPEQSLLSHLHGCWQWYDASEHAGLGEARAVDELVAMLVHRHGFDARRVHVAGLSAGAGLASLLALHFPQRFASVALHSGPAFGEARTGVMAMDVMRRGLHLAPTTVVDALFEPGTHPGMPALIIHGTDDAVVVPKNGEQLAAEFLRLNQMTDKRGALRGGQRIEAHEDGVASRDYRRGKHSVVRLCMVEGLGHAWSGGDDAAPFHDAAGPDASAMIWQFFRDAGPRPASSRA